jgi:hypothetical protein
MRGRTKIKRCDVLRALVLLADGGKPKAEYAKRIEEVAVKYRHVIYDDHEKLVAAEHECPDGLEF